MNLLPLWAAFSFLTRLAPPRHFSERDMAASMAWAPFVGLALGALSLAPVLVGIAASSPALRALIWISVMAWATRALHWDGLADCMDAWGSGAHGENFQAILKDSRCGSFGVLALLLALAVQAAALTELFAGPLPSACRIALIAPAWGRTGMLFLPALLPPHPVSTLGRLMAPACTLRLACAWLAALLSICTIFAGMRVTMAALTLSLGAQVFLYRLARRENGFNGDFLGASCILCESALLISPLL